MSFNRVYGKQLCAELNTTGFKNKFAFSLLTLCITHAFAISAANAANSATTSDKTRSEQTLVVTADDNNEAKTEATKSYTVPATRAGTKMNLTQRDIPQSVSVLTQQRIKDQNLQNVGDALANVTGISASQNDSERVDFYSRGFYLDNYTYDDIPSAQTGAWNFGETDGDSAIYERIDIVRGATGLMTGTGNPWRCR